MNILPEFNEENYLDNLLNNVEKGSGTVNENREKYIQKLEEEEIENAKSPEEKQKEEIVEQVKKVVEEASNKDRIDSDIIEEDIDNVGKSDTGNSQDVTGEEDMERLLESVSDSNNDNASSSNLSVDNQSEQVEELSEEELDRLANMNLDELLSEASDGKLSEKDLPYQGEEEDNIASEETSAAGIDSLFGGDGDSQGSNVQDKEVEQIEDLDVNAKDTKNTSDSEKTSKSADNSEGQKQSKKQEKTKDKKKKKGLLSIVKGIFFESLEDEVKAEEAIKEHEKDTANDIQGELTNTLSDENERVIKEVYGEGSDNNTAQPKGLIAKLKYRLDQFKKKNAEEDAAEEEAERLDYEEKQKKKSAKKEEQDVKKKEKKAKADEKKAAAKSKKEAKPKKEKKPKKPKKEKKPKEPPKPGDILKIKPLSVVFFIMFIAGVCVLIVVLNTGLHSQTTLNNAKSYVKNNNYAKAYAELSGNNLNEREEEVYNQASVVMYVQRQYESYQNYTKMGMKTEALNALIKGLARYNKYASEAAELGVSEDINTVRQDILSALQNTYKISEEDAQSLVNLSKENFTQYYYRIEAYGDGQK